MEANSLYYKDKAVLCPKNVDVDRFNEEMLKTLPGEEQIYYSADNVPVGDMDSDEGLYVTTEFLNSINLSGMPPHLLIVKVGTVMMLLRNLNPKRVCVTTLEFLSHKHQQDYYKESSSQETSTVNPV